MDEKYIIEIDEGDLHQIIDGLTIRAESYRRTEEYYESSIEPDEAIELVSNGKEARKIAEHYEAIVHSLNEQKDNQPINVTMEMPTGDMPPEEENYNKELNDYVRSYFELQAWFPYKGLSGYSAVAENVRRCGENDEWFVADLLLRQDEEGYRKVEEFEMTVEVKKMEDAFHQAKQEGENT